MTPWNARSGISEAGKLPSGPEMPPEGPLQPLISKAPGAELEGYGVFSWHQVPVNGNVILVYPVGLARNSRTLVWLNYKRTMLLWDTMGIWDCWDQCTEMWKSGSRSLSKDPESGCALFFSSSKNKCIPCLTTLPSFTSSRSSFHYLKWMKWCPCGLVARLHGSKHSSLEIYNLVGGATPPCCYG